MFGLGLAVDFCQKGPMQNRTANTAVQAPTMATSSARQAVMVREAVEEDFPRIAELHNLWFLPNLRGEADQGFLLLETSPRQIRAFDTEENSILVACIADKVAGYLIATGMPEMLDGLKWQENVATSISSTGHRHVKEMAVDPDLTGRGLGKSLYEHLLSRPDNLHFSAYVATGPLRNTVSIGFHKRMGFRAVATFAAREFCGIQGYSSMLFFKEKPRPT